MNAPANPRRFRQCPDCDKVYAASQFRVLTYGSNWSRSGRAKRQCPNCGYKGRTTSRLTAAIAAHQQAAHAVAEACYQAAITEAETASGGWNGLAVLHEQRGEFEAADEAWTKTALDPTAATVHNRALSALRRGDPLAGRELLAGHWELVIDSPPLLFLQGYLALISGDAETAMIGVKGALELDPHLARFHFTLALIQQEVGNPSAALESVRRALLMSPWYLPQVWLLSGVNGAITELTAGEPDLSIATVTETILLSLGRSLLEAGHLGESLAVFDQALTRDAHHPVALFHRGVVLAKLRRYREALEDWESVGVADQTGDLAALSARHSVSARRLAELFSS